MFIICVKFTFKVFFKRSLWIRLWYYGRIILWGDRICFSIIWFFFLTFKIRLIFIDLSIIYLKFIIIILQTRRFLILVVFFLIIERCSLCQGSIILRLLSFLKWNYCFICIKQVICQGMSRFISLTFYFFSFCNLFHKSDLFCISLNISWYSIIITDIYI
jgi:hypothetical protein